MALQFVNKSISDGSANHLTVTGIDSDDVYLLLLYLIQTQNSNETINLRVTQSGTENSTSIFDRAASYISDQQSHGTRYYENGTATRIFENVQNANGGGAGMYYLYNFNDSDKYSYMTVEYVAHVSNQNASYRGGAVHTQAAAADGVKVYGASGGTFIEGATALLYKVT